MKLGHIEYFIQTSYQNNDEYYSVKSRVWNRGMFGDAHWFENHVAGPFPTKQQAQDIYDKLT